jgi:hypothetical protein
VDAAMNKRKKFYKFPLNKPLLAWSLLSLWYKCIVVFSTLFSPQKTPVILLFEEYCFLCLQPIYQKKNHGKNYAFWRGT